MVGPCTFPQFIFSYFYLYTEGLLGSIVNVARDGILRWPGRSRVRATVGEQKLVRAVVGAYEPRAKLRTSQEQNCVRAKSKIAYDPRAKLSTSRHQKCVRSYEAPYGTKLIFFYRYDVEHVHTHFSNRSDRFLQSHRRTLLIELMVSAQISLF